jgi:hypothetical protein
MPEHLPVAQSIQKIEKKSSEKKLTKKKSWKKI